jgi:hypothetical protein
MSDHAKQIDALGGLAMETGCHNTLKALDIARALLRERDELLSYKRSVMERVNVCVGCDNWGTPVYGMTTVKPFTVEIP